jgi:hypothetical protein
MFPRVPEDSGVKLEMQWSMRRKDGMSENGNEERRALVAAV